MVIIDARDKFIEHGSSKLWNYCLQYAMAKKQSARLGVQYLQMYVPPQLWYQVQTTSADRYEGVGNGTSVDERTE